MFLYITPVEEKTSGKKRNSILHYSGGRRFLLTTLPDRSLRSNKRTNKQGDADSVGMFGEVEIGKKKRTGPDTITIFDSTRLAIQDLAIAKIAMKHGHIRSSFRFRKTRGARMKYRMSYSRSAGR